MRVEIYVRPGASRAGVGGVHDGALVVRVMEPADAGRATEAALRAVAAAVGVPRRSVSVLHGTTSRRKLLEIDIAADDVARAEGALAGIRGRSAG